MAKGKANKPGFSIQADTDLDALLGAMGDDLTSDDQGSPSEESNVGRVGEEQGASTAGNTPGEGAVSDGDGGAAAQTAPPAATKARAAKAAKPRATKRKTPVDKKALKAKEGTQTRGGLRENASKPAVLDWCLDPTRESQEGDPIYVDAATKKVLRFVAHRAAGDLPIGQLADRIIRAWLVTNRTALLERTTDNPLAAMGT